MSSSPHKLSVREKVGYSLSDIGTNFFFQSMILYQTKFYTDTVGLDAAVVGSMFLLVRFADAIFDPVIGALADRTNTRWGKFRPWLLFTAIPFGLVYWMVYNTPGGGVTTKLIYAYATYIAVMVLYSANNTPYSALMGVMTPDASERTSIAQFRFISAMIGQLLITALALPLVDKFGGGNSAHGWSTTMMIFGVVIVVCNLVAFGTTRERIVANPAQKSSLRDDLRDVFTCRPWLILFVFTLVVFTTLVLRGSSLNYYFTYYLDSHRIMQFLDGVGLGSIGAGPVTGWRTVLDWFGLIVKPDGSNAASVGFSFFSTVSILVQVPGILVSKRLADRYGKKAVFIGGMGLSTVATALIFFVPRDSMNLLFFVSMLWPLGWGPTIPLLWVMIADVADFSEWKNNRRATGFMYAGILFALKAGLGLGGALSGWLIAAYDYHANVAQNAEALLGIRLCASIYPSIPFALGLVCLAIYPIGKALNRQIELELAERRQATATA